MPAPKSPHEMFQVMKANVEEKTGKSFKAWVGIAKKAGLDKHKALTDWIKKEHGVSHGYAQMIAWGVIDPQRLEASNSDTGMVDALYSGKKTALRPIYDKLIKQGQKLGKDVDVIICKTYSSLRSKSQFAVLAPRTNGAIDIELAMPPGTKPKGRLEPFKSSNPKLTHRIRITDAKEVDAVVLDALKSARAHIGT